MDERMLCGPPSSTNAWGLASFGQEGVETVTASGFWSAPPERWDEDTPEQLLLRRETRALVDRTIAELPAGQRAVIPLKDVEGLDSAEVCNILEISETNQRVLLHRARSRVRTALEQYLQRV